MTNLMPDEGKTRLRWFLRVKKGGSVEDLMTGTESSGLFVEFLWVEMGLMPYRGDD
jgi:hypothetical protein